MVLHQPISVEIKAKLEKSGFLVNAPNPNVIRLAPPLIISAEQADALITALDGLK